MASAIVTYFSIEDNRQLLADIIKEVTLEDIVIDRSNDLINGKAFVVTGSLNTYSGRDELKALIESLGGKVTGSVTGKTEALINNDINSNSSKNKKAKELGVKIISEADFNLNYLGK